MTVTDAAISTVKARIAGTFGCQSELVELRGSQLPVQIYASVRIESITDKGSSWKRATQAPTTVLQSLKFLIAGHESRTAMQLCRGGVMVVESSRELECGDEL